MVEYISKDAWIPADGMKLESSARMAVESETNTLVVAGPGAGKTELLAQRACYLLQTNECSWPKRILAISFKRDAAANIKERVKKRCGDDLADRFDSFTFDGFAFFLLNRFHHCLPQKYKINFPVRIIWNERNIYNLYEQQFRDRIARVQEKEVLNQHHRSLPINEDGMSYLIWRQLLDSNPSNLSFRMVMRLAQLIVESNSLVKKLLRQSYSHIFLDEFQDTTTLQFDFVKRCFDVGKHIFTAVGDDKQKIMGWAGADKEIFEKYKETFTPDEIMLTMNFRSAPKLVELQNYLIKELLQKDSLMQPSSTFKQNGAAYSFLYDNSDAECNHIIDFILKRMKNDNNLNPRSFCILVKQQVSVYCKKFIAQSGICGLMFRDEDPYSKWLDDEVFSYLLNCLLVVAKKDTAAIWDELHNFIFRISYSIDDEKNWIEEKKFEAMLRKLRRESDFSKVIDEVLSFADKKKIGAIFTDYRNLDHLDECIKTLINWINRRISCGMSLAEALVDIRGDNSIPIMTIHKSKGLEYDTVIFIGLEDIPFRDIGKEESEDENAFFVALSRAKNVVVFTFAGQREDKYGNLKPQSVQNVSCIYNVLNNSSLVEFQKIP